VGYNANQNGSSICEVLLYLVGWRRNCRGGFQEERPVALLPVIIPHTTIFCGMLKVC
jgi:hypothetical protein